MRGHGVRPVPKKFLAGLLLFLFLIVPFGSVSASDLPTLASDHVPVPVPPGEAEEMPLHEFVESAVTAVRETGGTRILRPDQFPQYGAMEEDEQRALWQVWQMTVAHARITDPGHVLVAEEDTTRGAASETMAIETPVDPPQGLRGLWTLDVHGTPREVLSAGDGAYLLITSQGILRFEDGADRPSWMVKTGSMQRAETTDVNGDGTYDIVMTLNPWFVREGDPNLIVIDGRTGDRILQAFKNENALSQWRLTDIGNDGTMDLVGVTISGQLVGAALDGTIHWQEPLPFLYEGTGFLLVYAFVYYFSSSAVAFGDFDGDGVLDVVSTANAYAWVMAFLVYEQASATTHTAWSGADGSTIWTMPLPLVGEYGYAFPTTTGDLDGDGNDDIGYAGYGLLRAAAFPAPVYQYVMHYGSFIMNGKDGILLADDRGFLTYGFPLFLPLAAGGAPYAAILGFADLDRDGNEELLTLELGGYWMELESIDLVGRGIGIGPGPTAELWRHSLTVENVLNGWDMSARLRDTDGDGRTELRVHLAGYQTDKSGAIVHEQSSATVITATDRDEHATDVFTFDSDVDPGTGRAYAWTQDDRWTDFDGASEGLQLVTFGRVGLVHDVTGDKNPDLLIPKSSGLHWLDGKTGRTAMHVDRPLNRDVDTVAPSDGTVHMVERDWSRGISWGRDATDGSPLWTIDREAFSKERDDLWPYGFDDFTGDGRLDLLARASDYRASGTEHTFAIFSLPELTETWRIDLKEGYVRPLDVLTRPGVELLHSDEWYGNDPHYSLIVPGEAEARWKIDATDRYLRTAGGDHVVLEHYADERSLEVYDAVTGSLNRTFTLPEETAVRSVQLHAVDADSTVDLVLELYKYRRGGNEQFVVVQSLADGRQIARFDTEPSESRYGSAYMSMGGMMVMTAYDFAYYSRNGVQAAIADWDGDAHRELVFLENERVVVRSGATGETLASSKGRIQHVYAVDLNGDGKSEIGTLSAHGRLRFHSYSAGLLEAPEGAEELVLHVVHPDGPVTEDPSFFEEETGLLPSAGILPVLALLGLLGVLVRRRR